MTFSEEVRTAIQGVVDAQDSLNAHGTWDELYVAVSRLRQAWERAKNSAPPRDKKEE